MRPLLSRLAGPVVAVFVFGWGVGRPAFWIDEAATVQDSGRPIGDLLRFLGDRDAALGPYYVFMHFWLKLGDSEWWVRLPSMLAMVAAVALTAAMARRWWGELAGLTAGLLMALSPVISRYAQEARPYAFAVAFAVLATWMLQRRRWVGYSVAVCLLGLAHIVGLLVLLSHFLFVRRKQNFRALLIAMGAGIVLPIGLVGFAILSRSTVSWIPRPDVKTFLFSYGEIAGGWGFLIILGLLAALGARGNREFLPLLAWFAVPAVLLGLLGLVTPLFSARYLVVCAPALVLLAASAMRKGALPDVALRRLTGTLTAEEHGQLGRLPAGMAIARSDVGDSPARVGDRPIRVTWAKGPARPRILMAGLVVLVAALVALPALESMRAVDGHGPDTRAAARIMAAHCDPVQSGVATVRALPYYLRKAGCPPRLISGSKPSELWVVRPDWAKGSGSPGPAYRSTLSATVPGLRLSLWRRPTP